MTVPDLITILDQDGSAISTHDIRYGLRVSVIAMPAHPLWKTGVGVEGFGPRRVGLDMEYIEFENQYAAPPSVFQHFARRNIH